MAETFVTNSQSQATKFFLNLPFGETMIEQMDGSYENPFKFNAKELDDDTGLYYYGARYYNPRLSIWYGVDSLAVYNPVMETEFYGDGQHNQGVYNWGNLNPYIYTYQNPIRYIDTNGKQVDAVFNKSTGILNIIPNVSKLNPRLSNKFVSAQTYSRLTNQDKTKFNYGIQVKNVFTGGHSESGVVSRDNSSTSNEKPIPNGNYNILDNDADTNHSGWFRLDKIDSSPHNDKDDASGRNGFRLHLGTVSWGCVTCDISQVEYNQRGYKLNRNRNS